MLNRSPAFLGQVRLLPPTYPPPIPPGGFPLPMPSPSSSFSQGGFETFSSGGSCPAGQHLLRIADRPFCAPNLEKPGLEHYPPVGPGAVYGPTQFPPQIQPPIETPPYSLTDIGPEPEPQPELPPVPSQDELYSYGTSMAPQGEGGCPPGQYHPTWSAHCVPKGGGGFGGGLVDMAPTAAPSFAMGRAMLGRVRLAGHPNLSQKKSKCPDELYKWYQDQWNKAAQKRADTYQAESDAWQAFKESGDALRKNQTNENFDKHSAAEKKWRDADKAMKQAEAEKQRIEDAWRDCDEGKATSMVPSVGPSYANVRQGQINQPQSYANVRMTPTSPLPPPPITGMPGLTSTMEQGGIETFTPPPPPSPPEVPSVDMPHTFEPAESEMPTPETEGVEGLPCPPGQSRPPGGGWCAPNAPVQTGYSPQQALSRFGGYGGVINMAPNATSFAMGRAMLGRVKLVRRPY